MAAIVALVQTLAAPSGGIFSPYDSARIVFLYAAIIGTPLAVFYGAPLYALLSYRGLASWPATLLLGLAPGAAVYFFVQNEQLLGVWLAAAGVAAALLTHCSMRQAPRSNALKQELMDQ